MLLRFGCLFCAFRYQDLPPLDAVKKNHVRHSDYSIDLPDAGVEEICKPDMECLNGDEAPKLNRIRYGFGGTVGE